MRFIRAWPRQMEIIQRPTIGRNHRLVCHAVGQVTHSAHALAALTDRSAAPRVRLSGIPSATHATPERHTEMAVRQDMSGFIQASATRPVPIPLREILPWAVFAGVLALLFIYFVGAEQGATALISGHYVHEFVHDGRHLLAFPCH
jgi:Probable cobalt transporter subunit (CbtB)